jgi:predicted RNA polymerase sigma factor
VQRLLDEFGLRFRSCGGYDYHYLHATRAELLRRLDRVDDARAAYDRALELVH